MRKIILNLLTAFFLFSIYPNTLNAEGKIIDEENSIIYSNDSTQMSEHAKGLILRLNEIKEMDKSRLSISEKKQLKNEVRTLKAELKALNGGIYLTVGEVIIILLLLILLL